MPLPAAYLAILQVKLEAAHRAGAESARLTFAETPDPERAPAPLAPILDAHDDAYGDDRLAPDAVQSLIQAMLGAEPGGADAVLSEFHHRVGDGARMTFASLFDDEFDQGLAPAAGHAHFDPAKHPHKGKGPGGGQFAGSGGGAKSLEPAEFATSAPRGASSAPARWRALRFVRLRQA